MTKAKKVLIGCEFSGVIREQFTKMGYDAMSCDLKPCLMPGSHYQGDIFNILGDGFDLLIAHPPCQYLSTAANHVINAPGRAALRADALEFFMKMYNAPIKHVCVENPQGFVNSRFRRPDQTIHPYYFGDKFLKRTCLWLRNLPKLDYDGFPLFGIQGTKIAKPEPIRLKNKKVHWTESVCGKNRQEVRSISFPGIARAMSIQWTEYMGTAVMA